MSIKRNLRVRADAVADLEPVSRVSVKDTVMERLLEEVSFEAEDRAGETLIVDAAFVEKQLASIARNADLSRYVL